MGDRYEPAPLPIEPIFDRQTAETDPAFEAFVTYRDMGFSRTLREVAQKVGKDATLIAAWSSRWQWVKRCSAWDTHLDKQRQKAMEQATATMAERHAKAAMNWQTILQQPLAAVGRHLQLDPKALDKMTLKELLQVTRDLSGAWKTAVDVERISRGGDTDRIQHTGLTVDDFRAAALAATTARQSADPVKAPPEPVVEVPMPAPPSEDKGAAEPPTIVPAVTRPGVRRNRRPGAPDPYGPPATA